MIQQQCYICHFNLRIKMFQNARLFYWSIVIFSAQSWIADEVLLFISIIFYPTLVAKVSVSNWNCLRRLNLIKLLGTSDEIFFVVAIIYFDQHALQNQILPSKLLLLISNHLSILKLSTLMGQQMKQVFSFETLVLPILNRNILVCESFIVFSWKVCCSFISVDNVNQIVKTVW